MALLKWTAGDVITARSANNKGIRKGTEGEIAAIASADRENGDFLYNTSNAFFGVPQVQLDATADDRANLHILLGADSTEVSIASATPTQVKDLDFIKSNVSTSPHGFSGQQISIMARIKQSGGGTTSLVMEVDGGPTDEITLTSTNASYEIKSGTYDASGLAAGYHTLEFYLSNTTNTGFLQALEVWGL